MSAMASQITSLTIIYWTIYSGADQRKHQSSASLALCAGNSPVTGEFPAQRASNAENVSIWWRHDDHDDTLSLSFFISGRPGAAFCGGVYFYSNPGSEPQH